MNDPKESDLNLTNESEVRMITPYYYWKLWGTFSGVKVLDEMVKVKDLTQQYYNEAIYRALSHSGLARGVVAAKNFKNSKKEGLTIIGKPEIISSDFIVELN